MVQSSLGGSHGMSGVFSTPDDRLILALCGRTATSDVIGKRLGDPGLDWPRIIETVRAHRVAPLFLSRALSQVLPHETRDAISEDGRREVAEAVHDSLVFRGELERIVPALASRGIPCILIKGLSLNPSFLRSAGDIDLLVPRERLIDAMDAILGIPGYCYSESPSWGNGRAWRRHATLSPSLGARIAAQARTIHEFHMYHPDRGVLVELHVSLFTRAGRREDRPWGAAAGEKVIRRIWEEARPGPVPGCMAPRPEHSLLITCLHAALKRSPSGHLFRLSLLVDIDTLTASGIRWDEFMLECRELGVCPYASFSLRMARRLLGTPVPSAVLAGLSRECTPLQLTLTRFHLRCARSLNGSGTLYPILYRWLEPWAFGGTRRDRLRWLFLLPLWVPTRGQMAASLGIDEGSPRLALGYLLTPVWRVSRKAADWAGRLRRG
jgi:hypothetical protein